MQKHSLNSLESLNREVPQFYIAVLDAHCHLEELPGRQKHVISQREAHLRFQVNTIRDEYVALARHLQVRKLRTLHAERQQPLLLLSMRSVPAPGLGASKRCVEDRQHTW